MIESRVLSDWLDYRDDVDLTSLAKFTRYRTVDHVYRGMTLSELPHLHSTVRLIDYGRSYSYDFDVAWDFSNNGDDHEYRVIFDVDMMSHLDMKELSREIELSDDYHRIVDTEQEIVCMDSSHYSVVDIKTHRVMPDSTVYVISLIKQH